MGKSKQETFRLGFRLVVSESRPAKFQPLYVRPGGRSGNRFNRSNADSGVSAGGHPFAGQGGDYWSQGPSGSLERKGLGRAESESCQRSGAVGGEIGKLKA